MAGIKEAAKNPDGPTTSKTVRAAFAKMTKQEKAKMPKESSVKKTAWKMRNKTKKKIPKAPAAGEPHIFPKESKFLSDKRKAIHYGTVHVIAEQG